MEESSAAIAISCSLVKPTIVISIEKFIEMLSCGFVVDVEFLFRRLKVLTIATSLSSPLLALMFSLFPGKYKSLVFDYSTPWPREGARSNNWGGGAKSAQLLTVSSEKSMISFETVFLQNMGLLTCQIA